MRYLALALIAGYGLPLAAILVAVAFRSLRTIAGRRGEAA